MPERLAAAALALMLPVAACTPAPEPPDGEAPERITAVVLPFMTHMPYFIAREEGFFADEGLEVEFVKLGRSQEFMTALANREVDVTTGMLAVNELGMIASGVGVRAVAALLELSPETCTFVGVLARHELAEDGALEDPERIRRLVYDTDLLTPLGYQLDLLLRRRGLGVDDVQRVNLPGPAALGALANASIDALNEAEPFLSQHLESGRAVLWARGEDLTPGFPQSVMMFGPRLLEDRPDLGHRFAAAVLRGIDRFAEGKTPRNMEIVATATGQPPEVLERACWPRAPEGAVLDTTALTDYQEWSAARGLIGRVLEDDEFVDGRFFPPVPDDGPEPGKGD